MTHTFLPHADDVSTRYFELFMVDEYTWLGQLKPSMKSPSTDFDKRDTIHFGQCKINLGWLYVYIDNYIYNYIQKFLRLLTFFAYQLYLRAPVEFSPEHFLYFEAAAVCPRGKSSPAVTVALFAHGFLSFVCAARRTQVFCACVLLNMTCALINGYLYPFTPIKLHMVREHSVSD